MTDMNAYHYTDNVHDVLAIYVNRLMDSTLRSEYKNIETLAADRELTDADTPLQRIDCGAADRVVTAPVADAVNNHPFFLVNASAVARTLTFKNNAGSVTLAILLQGEKCLALPDGTGGYWVLTATGVGGSGGDVVRTKYIITPTISTNNLVLALKYIDGNDCTTTNKLTFRVGSTEYELTAAMSFTKVAGTDWCKLGSAELAGLPHDLFVYAIGETGASAGLKFGYSRIPYARTMSDFVNTATDEKYIAGNWTNFNASDPVTNIGRFRAQLSAGAGYTWSIPSAMVVNRPIYETGVLSFQTVPTGFSANPSGVYSYQLVDRMCEVLMVDVNSGTSNATNFRHSLPFTIAPNPTANYRAPLALYADNGTLGSGGVVTGTNNTAYADLTKINAGAWIASGQKSAQYLFRFPVATP